MDETAMETINKSDEKHVQFTREVINIKKVRDPYLSVIVPTLNGKNSLERCLKSIRNQDFKDFELIVSDGNSEDNTVQIAKKFADRIVVSSKRSTPIQQNTGASISRGKVLVFVHHDVVLSKNYLNDAEKYSREYNLGKSFFNVESSILHIIYKDVSKIIDRFLIHFNMTSGANQLFVRASDFKKNGGFKNVYFWDLEFFKRIRKRGKIVMIRNTNCILIFNSSSIRFLKKSFEYLFFGFLEFFGMHRKL